MIICSMTVKKEDGNMERYECFEKIGEGAFGIVFAATKKSTGEKFAIKRLKSHFTWSRAIQYREFQALFHLPAHKHIVRLHELIRDSSNNVYFVFEFMETSLFHIVLHRLKNDLGSIPDHLIRHLLRQVLLGLRHIHEHGQFHRDLKPENILVHGNTCKIADFSLARISNETKALTSYVGTRWYRAPEILLGERSYGNKMDVFALGCIAAELYKQEPLFPGNDTIDQLRLIFQMLGTPCQNKWTEGIKMLSQYAMEDWPCADATAPVMVRRWLQTGSEKDYDDDVIDFCVQLLALDPFKRLSAARAVEHGYFSGVDYIDRFDASLYTCNSNKTTTMTPSHSKTTSCRSSLVTVSPSAPWKRQKPSFDANCDLFTSSP